MEYMINLNKMTMKNQEFKPFDRVLVRDTNDEIWDIDIYGYYGRAST